MASTFKRGSDKGKRNSRWMVSYYDAVLGKNRTVRGYSDREASIAMGERFERATARRAEGLTSDLDDQVGRPLGDHLAEHVAELRASGRADRYIAQVERRVTLLAARTGAARAVDLDPVKVLRAVMEHVRVTKKHPQGKVLSTAARNDYLATAKSFTRWCVQNRRIPHDPLCALKKLGSHTAPRAHQRRAITADEFSRLLDAAERRPLVELLTVRTGPNRGSQTARVRASVQDRARLLGRERRLAYLTAFWAGLRRSELAALSWDDLRIETATPSIQLRAETTKSRRADQIALHPQLAEALRQSKPAEVRSGELVFASLPDMKAMRADLRLADIDPGDATVGFVDFHSLRMSLSTMMAAHGMSQRSRQAQMRHTDPRLTEVTYVDARLLPVAAELGSIPDIPVMKSPNTAA